MTSLRPRHFGLSSTVLRYLGLTPFAAYVLLFLAVPTLIALGAGFADDKGAFTLDNILVLADPVILRAFGSSFWVSAVTAIAQR